MNLPIRILYVDDSSYDRELVRDSLEKEHGGFQLVEAASRSEFEKELIKGRYDLVLSDFNISGFEGLQVIEAVKAEDPDLPVIIVTGTGSEEVAIKTLRSGAAEYVIKTPKHIRSLPATILSVIEKTTLERKHRETIRALSESEDRYRDLVEHSHDLISTHSLRGEILSVNRAAVRTLGYSRDELLKMNIRDVLTDDFLRVLPVYMRRIRDKGYASGTFCVRTAKGELRFWEYSNSLRTEGVTEPIVRGMAHDVTERRLAEAEMKRLITAVEQVGEVVVITDTEGNIQFANPAFETATGYTVAEAIGKNPRILKSGKQDVAFYENLWSTIKSGKTFKGDMVNMRKDGTLYTERATISPVFGSSGKIENFIAVKQDISRQLLAEERLLQAQKMETVGRLAGGVAHDFNNMLQVILSYTEIALAEVMEDGPLRKYLLEIQRAGRRSAETTEQLLAFARKQTVEPKVLDLNEALNGARNMIQRLIREDVSLVWKPGPGLRKVLIDPAQLDQILTNLVVNARDALDGVGTITVATENASIDQAFCERNPDFISGNFAVLSVRDNGRGMDKDLQAHIFEPFFTTKEQGKGTGLGLSTVYGIVKQNGGHIHVYSEPGHGSLFKVFLPQAEGSVEAESGEQLPAERRKGAETILIVEDEASILGLAKMSLELLGYTVLAADLPKEALRLSRQHEGKLDLLITDVIMPQMNGQDLSSLLRADRPGLKTLFMSGYTADVIVDSGVLEGEACFINKPFSLDALADKVRRILDS